MLTPEQRDILIRTVWGEAANQGPQGWAAVASVLRNRASNPAYPSDPAAVALQPKQFSAWNPGQGGNALPYTIEPGSSAYDNVGRVIDQVFSGQIADPTGGALNYYAPKGMRNGAKPSWWNTIDPNSVRTIGGHIFGSPAGANPPAITGATTPVPPPVFGGLVPPTPSFASGPLARLGQALASSNDVTSSYTPVNQPANVTGAEVQNLANGDTFRQYTINGKTIKTLTRGNTNYAVLG